MGGRKGTGTDAARVPAARGRRGGTERVDPAETGAEGESGAVGAQGAGSTGAGVPQDAPRVSIDGVPVGAPNIPATSRSTRPPASARAARSRSSTATSPPSAPSSRSRPRAAAQPRTSRLCCPATSAGAAWPTPSPTRSAASSRRNGRHAVPGRATKLSNCAGLGANVGLSGIWGGSPKPRRFEGF